MAYFQDPYGTPEPSSDEPSLKDVYKNILEGFQKRANWEQGLQDALKLRQDIPKVAESLTRGAIASAGGAIGDIRDLREQFKQKLVSTLPDSVKNLTAGLEYFGLPATKYIESQSPSTKQILETVPRITPTHEGADVMEEMGGIIAPGMGYVGGRALKGMKDMPMGLMMIGPESTGWNKEMAFLASKLEKQGKTPEEIWQATGTARGLDTHWRQEISDESSFLKGGPTFEDNVLNRMKALGTDKPTVKDIMYHPELLKNYPDLGDIEIQFTKKGSKSNAEWLPTENIIRVNPELPIDKANKSILHELQHAIQRKEGWATGADAYQYLKKYQNIQDDLDKRLEQANESIKKAVGTKDYESLLNERDKISKEYMEFVGQNGMGAYEKALKEYKSVKGEAEARLTQEREKLNKEQRLQNFPFKQGEHGLDVNPKETIDDYLTRSN